MTARSWAYRERLWREYFRIYDAFANVNAQLIEARGRRSDEPEIVSLEERWRLYRRQMDSIQARLA